MTLTTVKGSVLNRGVNVKDYGAVGDGVTDDTAAIQAALDYALSSGVRGKVIVPPGNYRTTATITVEGTGITLEGMAGEKASVITADFLSGSAIQVKNRYSGLRNLEIVGSSTRKASGSGHGVRVEADDVSGFRVTSAIFDRLVIRNHPGNGIIVYGANWDSEYRQLRIYDNSAHGIQFDSGFATRTFAENPGIVNIVLCDIFSNGGNGIIIGNDDDVTNRGLRFFISNCDLYFNALAAGTRKTATQLWAFVDTMLISNCGFDGGDGAATRITRGCTLSGRGITIQNSRFFNVDPDAIYVYESSAGYVTSGIKIDNIVLFDTYGGMSLDPVVNVSNDVKNISIRLGSNIENYAPISTIYTLPVEKTTNIVRLDANFTVNNQATVQNTGLTFPMLNKEIIQFRAVLIYQTNTTADARISVDVPTGASIMWTPANGLYLDTSLAVTSIAPFFSSASTLAIGGDTGWRTIELVGEVETTGTSGDFTIQFAQSTATVVDTKLNSASSLTFWKVG